MTATERAAAREFARIARARGSAAFRARIAAIAARLVCECLADEREKATVKQTVAAHWQGKDRETKTPKR